MRAVHLLVVRVRAARPVEVERLERAAAVGAPVARGQEAVNIGLPGGEGGREEGASGNVANVVRALDAAVEELRRGGARCGASEGGKWGVGCARGERGAREGGVG